MKIIPLFLSAMLIVCLANATDKTYTGSTPAGPVVRSFLGIPLPDSIDFIRWKFIISDNRYRLQCNYGIGKANTNGFIDGGIKIELSGECRKAKNYFQFKNGTQTLNAVELNAGLFHLLSADNSLLVGNGGWSYTLNHIASLGSGQCSIISPSASLKDSMAFEGRTPCKVPGVIAAGKLCYKLKWYIVIYANAQTNGPKSYKILGTRWRQESGKAGNWKIITGQKGRITYQLDDHQGKAMMYLVKLDEHILVFSDAQGKLLVGDEDFSYTLNRKW